MNLLAPDLLDRRALALIRLVDVYGAPVAGPVRIAGDGIAAVAKGQGTFALLAAAGFEDYLAAFDAPPAAPAIGARPARLDLTPASPALAPRGALIALPRDPDPARALLPASLFQAAEIALLPSPVATPLGSACAVRVSVRRKDDGRVVENALVRGQSDDGLLAARALTDARGEACLVFPALPLSFPGAGASIQHDLGARLIVHVDPASAAFHDPGAIAGAIAAARARLLGHADPDAIAAAFAADFPAGAAVRIAAGRQPSIALSWTAP
jgi:hypothetical protein